MTTCQTYVSEISPIKIRGVLLAFLPFSACIGQLIAISLVFSRIMIFDISSFRLPFAVQWVFSGLAIISGFVVPESPVILISRGNNDGARKTYLRLHGSSSNISVDNALNNIQATLDHERAVQAEAGTSSFVECFKGTNLRRTLIIVLVAMLQYFLGVSLLANANYFLIMAGMSPSQSLTISQIGVGVQLPCIIIGAIAMSTFGRRVIVLWSSGVTGMVFVGMGVAGFFQAEAAALR